MIDRYANPKIKKTWSDEHKLELWQKVELAVIEARETLGRIKKGITARIGEILNKVPPDLGWWKVRDREIHHDFQAFVDERRRNLPDDLASRLHEDTTSYDTEEPAFSGLLDESYGTVKEQFHALREAVKLKALKYRYTPMLARTHGQWAQIQSFGYECLTWYTELDAAWTDVSNAASRLLFTKCSGAIGNHAEIDPELEYKALALLNKKPWPGATQIMPRVLYAQLASSLGHLLTVCEKISLDIRLGARSGYKIMEEPYNPNQKGSSAMPQKRNPIRDEQLAGMGRLARHYAGALGECIVTWESRAIEQSCVERVAWPDLFHVVMQTLTVLTKVIDGLNIYPDQMMREIAASAGTYASNAAKSFLAKHGEVYGISPDDAYGIVRLASHIAFEPSKLEQTSREVACNSLDDADRCYRVLEKMYQGTPCVPESIATIIMGMKLHERPDIGVSGAAAAAWNEKIRVLFLDTDVISRWHELFSPSRGMKNEGHSFKQVFGV